MNTRAARLFFIELIFVLLSFSVSAAVCIRLFAAAYDISQNSFDASGAVVCAQAAAETFKAIPGDPDALRLRLSAQEEGSSLVVYYDAEWNTVGTVSDRRLTMTLSPDGAVTSADITVTKDGVTLFSLLAVSAWGNMP
jgi:hypothetical protein